MRIVFPFLIILNCSLGNLNDILKLDFRSNSILFESYPGIELTSLVILDTSIKNWFSIRDGREEQ
jgi:hypothetical protein